jgi:O-antigen ligase
VLLPTSFLLLLLLALQLLSAGFARDPLASFGSVATFAVEGVALYLLITNALRTLEDLRGAAWALVAAGVLMSVVPIFQQVTGNFASNYGGLGQVDAGGFETGEASDEGVEEHQSRLAGPIGETNRYAQVMLVLVPLALERLTRARKGWLRLVTLGSAFSIAVGFALAFSRGGAVGMLCLLGAMLALRLIDVRKVLGLAAGLALVLLVVPQYWTRIATLGTSVQVLDAGDDAPAADGAVRRRVTEMLAALHVFFDHPLIGVGPGQFKQYSVDYGKDDALRRIDSGRRAHSLYLEFAAENGAIGLTLLLGAIASTLADLAAARRALLARGGASELVGLTTACVLALVAYLSTGVFLHLSYMRYFYLVLALGGAVAHVALRAARAAPEPAAGAAEGALGTP